MMSAWNSHQTPAEAAELTPCKNSRRITALQKICIGELRDAYVTNLHLPILKKT
jgi:hypothetical protein